MEDLKVKNNLFILFFWLTSCTTSSFYRIHSENDGATELLVSPDRVLLQCEELDEEPDVGAHGFMIHILDEKKTVTTLAYNIRPDKETCKKWMSNISRILKTGRRIYIGNRMNLTSQPRTDEDKKWTHTFPKYGTFASNSRSLEFVVIANEKGQCYSPSYQKNEPCPQFPFPIGKFKK